MPSQDDTGRAFNQANIKVTDGSPIGVSIFGSYFAAFVGLDIPTTGRTYL